MLLLGLSDFSVVPAICQLSVLIGSPYDQVVYQTNRKLLEYFSYGVSFRERHHRVVVEGHPHH